MPLPKRATALLQQVRTAVRGDVKLPISSTEGQGQRSVATLAYDSLCSKPDSDPAAGAEKPTSMIVHGLLGSG